MSRNTKIEGMSNDKDSEITETIVDPVKTLNRMWDRFATASDEILILLSSANAFTRQENAGSVEILKNLCLRRHNLKIRLLTPKSEHVEQVRSEIRKAHYNFDIKFIQEFSQTKISIIVIDRKYSFVIELKNDYAVSTFDAMGIATYSTRILTVLSYVSIFESYWALSQMYEESMNELEATKEYLNKVLKVLKEINNKGK
jgi:hypothetical protein